MASAFAQSSGTEARREPAKVVRYQLKAEDHVFTKKDADGNAVPTGEEKPVAKLRGVRSDGSVDKLAAWIWLDTPDAIDALLDSMPDLYRAAQEIRAIGEKSMGWKPRATAKAAAPAAPAAPAKKASAFVAALDKEAEAVKNGTADPFADLPF